MTMLATSPLSSGTVGVGVEPAASAGVSTAMMPLSAPAVRRMPSLAMFAGPGPAGRVFWTTSVMIRAAISATATVTPLTMRNLLRRSRFFCSSRRTRAFSLAASLRSLRDGRG